MAVGKGIKGQAGLSVDLGPVTKKEAVRLVQGRDGEDPVKVMAMSMGLGANQRSRRQEPPALENE